MTTRPKPAYTNAGSQLTFQMGEDGGAGITEKRHQRGVTTDLGGHIGPTLAPEAILFESPCRANSETKMAKA